MFKSTVLQKQSVLHFDHVTSCFVFMSRYMKL